jgi:hypothetical protein
VPPADDALREKLARTLANGGQPRLLTPLPRTVRLRLALTRRVNALASWLSGRGHWRAARRLYQVLRMWP